MSEISEAARRLKHLRERSGLSMRQVADALGWSLTRYQHYEDRYKRRWLPLDLTRQLGSLFETRGIDPQELLALAGLEAPDLPAPRMGPASGPALNARDLVMAPPGLGRDLPVLGAVKGGSEGFYFNEGEAKEFVLRPVGLQGVANGFALYVDGDSMEPRYFAGEMLYVNPNRPITKGCFVAIELADGQGLIKQFLRRSDDLIVLRQYNPAKDLRLAARDVKRLYRITGSAETS